MIVLGGAIIGMIIGLMRARAQQGSRLDKLQYAAVYTIMFMVIGLFITLFIHRGSL